MRRTDITTSEHQLITAVLATVAYAHDVTVAQIRSGGRRAELVRARVAVIDILTDAGLSTTKIGAALDRDHSTIVHHLRKRPHRDAAYSIS